jgi:hypothetical protein
VAWRHEEGGQQGLAVSVELRSEHFHHSDSIIRQAQDVMQRHTGQLGNGVSLLPQGSFRRSPRGFDTTVVDMKDESRACWDAYGTGCCHRGALCRWQHPHWSLRFRLILQLASGSGHMPLPSSKHDDLTAEANQQQQQQQDSQSGSVEHLLEYLLQR